MINIKTRSVLKYWGIGKVYKKDDGITLLEVIVVIAIMSILLGPIMSLLISNIQFKSRVDEDVAAMNTTVDIKDYIYDPIRLAREVELANNISTSPSFQSIYIDSITGALMHRKADGTEIEVYNKKLMGNNNISLIAEKSTSSDKVMYLNIKTYNSVRNREIYSLKVPIGISNMLNPTDKIILNPSSSTTFSVINFKHP